MTNGDMHAREYPRAWSCHHNDRSIVRAFVFPISDAFGHSGNRGRKTSFEPDAITHQTPGLAFNVVSGADFA
jgi:hypothetical protein